VVSAQPPRTYNRNGRPRGETRPVLSREREALEMACRGHRPREIAAHFGVALRTAQGWIARAKDAEKTQ